MPKNVKVFVVEDDRRTAEFIKSVLGQQHYAVTLASSDEDIIALIQRDLEIALVLLDVIQPGLKGLDLLEQLKRDVNGAEIPVIVLDASNKLDHKALAFAKGAADFIIKPFAENELLTRVGTQLKLKQAATDFKQHQVQQGAILDSLKAVTWSTLPHNFTLNDLNGAVQKIFGRSKEEFLKAPDLWFSITHPDDQDKARSLPDMILRKGNHAHERRIIRSEDGHIRWVLDRGKAIYGDDDQIIRIDGLTTDITEEKLAEQTLWNTAARFKALVENSTDVVLILDEEGLFRYSSPTTRKILDYVSEQIVGRNIFDFIHEDDISKVMAGYQMALQEPGLSLPEIEFRLRHNNGEWRTVAATITNLLESSTISGVLVNCHDITERTQANEALRKSEEHFRLIFELAPTGMGITTVEGRLLKLNQSYCDTLGYSSDELLGRNLAEITHPDDIMVEQVFIQQVLHSEIPYYQVEKRYIHKNGQTINVILQATLMRDDDNQPLHFIVQIIDITEHRKLEEQYRQSQKMEAIGQLAGGMAHDFNNLLTVITGYTQFLQFRYSDDEKLGTDLDEIQQASERASRLTRQLLAFSRRQMLKPEILDLNEIVVNIDKMLRRLIGENIEFQTMLAVDLNHANVDPGQIELVIVNLIVNARDAMPRGGQLSIKTANVFLNGDDLTSHSEIEAGHYVMLAVRDTGEGMDKETLMHIFEPFFTTKGVDKGTGLGLATVYGIIRQSKGHIVVESEPGQGTTFKMYFKAYFSQNNEDKLSNASDELSKNFSSGNETILLVEDESIVRKMIQNILNESGYTILEASNGEEAVQIVERQAASINMLITDLVMPKMSGRELGLYVEEKYPAMKILYISGYADNSLINPESLTLGNSFLQKPFSPLALTKKVREMLDTKIF